MNINNFVNGLAANPDSNIVSQEEWDEQNTQQYSVEITEVTTHVYIVRAATPDDAEIAARDRYTDGDDGDEEGIGSDIDSVRVYLI